MRSNSRSNGGSEAARGDGFHHICLLITLPSAASGLCARMSTPSNTRRAQIRLKLQVASLYADEVCNACREGEKAAHILNSLDKLRERCFVNAAELCKSVNKHTHEIRAAFR